MPLQKGCGDTSFLVGARRYGCLPAARMSAAPFASFLPDGSSSSSGSRLPRGAEAFSADEETQEAELVLIDNRHYSFLEIARSCVRRPTVCVRVRPHPNSSGASQGTTPALVICCSAQISAADRAADMLRTLLGHEKWVAPLLLLLLLLCLRLSLTTKTKLRSAAVGNVVRLSLLREGESRFVLSDVRRCGEYPA